MYKSIYTILFIVVLLVFGCSKREERGGSGASNIKLSDISANLSGKTLFVTNKSTSSSTSRYNIRSSQRSSTSSNSLLVIDNNSIADYGILSSYDIQIDQVRISPDNNYAYIILQHDSGDSNKDSNLYALNCGIIKVTLSDNSLNCVERGIIPIKRDNEWWYGENYALPSLQFSTNSIIYLISYSSGDNEVYKSRSDLNCEKYCLYRINDDQTTKLTTVKKETQAFYAFKSGSVVYYECDSSGDQCVESGIIYKDKDDNTFNISSRGGFFGTGDYDSILKEDDDQNDIFVSRVIDSKVRKTYLENAHANFILKGNDGTIYGHGGQGLISILPFKNQALISIPSNVACDKGLNCEIYFSIYNNIVVYNMYMTSQNSDVQIHAFNLNDNSTTTLLKSKNNCSSNCYKFDRSYQNQNLLYVSLKNSNTNKYESIKIDMENIDFSKDNDQFTSISSIDDFMVNKKINSISSISNNSSSSSPTAVVKHVANDNTSMRIEFNNIMDYSDVESKVSIIDNSTNSNIWFIPVWNNKTLHLVVDTDNGTVFDGKSDPLTSGRTYKVTLLGSAKDSDGNTLGSDVVKYITP